MTPVTRYFDLTSARLLGPPVPIRKSAQMALILSTSMARQKLPFYKVARAVGIREDELRRILAGTKLANGPNSIVWPNSWKLNLRHCWA